MNRYRHLSLAVGLVATIAGCAAIDPIKPRFQSGSADFSVYVAMGTSLAAGYASGGLVERHQRKSYAFDFALQAGSRSFTIPTMSDSGIPPLFVLRSYSPFRATRAATQGVPTNFPQPTSYHNMGIPGALLVDAIDSSLYSRSPLFALIQRGRGTILQQAIGLSPTFLSFEYGANEVLSAATQGSGTLLNPAFAPAQFAGMYTIAMNALAAGAPQCELALVNVPNVTSIPYFTTFPPFTVSLTGAPSPLVGPSGPLQLGDFVLLPAADSMAVGTGIPVGSYNYVNPSVPGNGRPLLDSQVLSVSEAAAIQVVIDAYNVIIDSVATNRNAALVDLNGLLRTVATTGVRWGPTTVTADFVTGGAFSLDGVHPTDLGYGLVANTMIDAVNAKFGASVPHVDLGTVATRGRYASRPAEERSQSKPWVQGLALAMQDLYGRLGPTGLP